MTVALDLVGEDGQAALDEPRDAVGMFAGTAAVHERDPTRELRLGALAAVAGDELCHRSCDGIETVDARAALAGVLVGEPAGNSRALGKTADLLARPRG